MRLALWYSKIITFVAFPLLILYFMLKEGEHEESNENLKSKVWKYFTADGASRGKATCNLCDKLVDRSGGSTTNMIRHLRNVHKKDPGCASGKSISYFCFCV